MIRRRRLVLVAGAILMAATGLIASTSLSAVGPGGERSGVREHARRAAPPLARVTWLAISDIHFNPFAGSDGPLTDSLAAAALSKWAEILAGSKDPPSGYGADTNYTLLASTLQSIERLRPKPQLVLIPGDFLAHDFEQQYDQYAADKQPSAYEAFVDKTIAFLAREFGEALPTSQFVIALGNNDSYCGDYESTPRSPFLTNMARAWKPLVSRGGGAPDFTAAFSQLGSYTARLPAGGGSIVVANDVYWSTKYVNACGHPSEDPGSEELQWLRAAVAGLPVRRPAWLTMHIPPGIDVYATLHSSGPVPLLRRRFQTGMILSTSGRKWAAGVFGHLHMNTFRVLTSSPQVPLLGTPSISPVDSNNPAYLVLSVDPATDAIVNYEAYAISLRSEQPLWMPEYSFDRTYALSGFDTGGLRTLQGRLRTNATMRGAYERYYTSGSGIGGITPSNFQAYWCGNVAMTAPAFATCDQPVSGKRPRVHRPSFQASS